MFEVICSFTDLQDNRHIYSVGDVYPRQGYQPGKNRIEELTTDNNRLHKSLIKNTDTEVRPARKKRGKKNENN